MFSHGQSHMKNKLWEFWNATVTDTLIFLYCYYKCVLQQLSYLRMFLRTVADKLKCV